MNNRIGWIDNLKAICILFVLLAHLDSGSPVLDKIYTPVFLTGFLFAAGYTFRPEPDFFVFLRKKVRTLLWPWLFFSTANLLLAQVLSFQDHGSFPEELKWNLLQIRGEGDGLWFIAALFVAFLPFYGIICRYEASTFRGKTPVLLVLTASLSALSTWYMAAVDPAVFPWNSPALPWHLEYVFQAVFFMTLGYLARKEGWKDRGWLSVLLYALTLLAGERIPLWLWYPWEYVKEIAGLFALMAVSRALPVHPVLSFLGGNTLLCFALHGKVMSLLQWLLGRCFSGGYALVLGDPWLSPLLAVTLTVLMALILLIPMAVINRWFPFLLGRRRTR